MTTVTRQVLDKPLAFVEQKLDHASRIREAAFDIIAKNLTGTDRGVYDHQIRELREAEQEIVLYDAIKGYLLEGVNQVDLGKWVLAEFAQNFTGSFRTLNDHQLSRLAEFARKFVLA